MTWRRRRRFYVTLFSIASRVIYENNTHADFIVKLSQPIDLRTCPNREVGVCKVSCSSPPLESLNAMDFTPFAEHPMIYRNLISPQFVDDCTDVVCGRSPPLPVGITNFETSTMCRWSSGNFSLSSQFFEFLSLKVLHVSFEHSTTPTNVVLHFRKNFQW